MLLGPSNAEIDLQKSDLDSADKLTGSSLQKYLNLFRKKGQISAEEFEKYTQVQCDRILEINAYYRFTKLQQKVYSSEFMAVKIEHVESDREIYVTPCVDLEHRNEFQQRLNLTYEAFDEPMHEIKLRHLCAVRDGLNWCRGEIVHIALPQVTVFLLDYGHNVCVQKKDICILKCPHASIRPFVLKCLISLLSTDDDELTEKAKRKITKELKRISNETTNVWLYFNGLVPKKSDTFDVLLFTDRQTNTKHINDAFSLHETYGAFDYRKIQFDNDLCKDWCDKISQITKRVETDTTKRVRVFLSHIVSPTEIYVRCDLAERFMPKIRKIIDAFVKSSNSKKVDKEKWSVGEDCLVRLQNWMTRSNLKLWYRGQITEIDAEKRKFTIFLRDYGRQVEVKSVDLLTIPAEMAACGNAVQRCSLCISEKWLDTSTEDLKKMIGQYETFAISCVSKSGSVLNVDLWATNNEPDIHNFEIWNNVGFNIISVSLRESMEPFILKTQHLHKISKYGQNRERMSDTTDEHYFKHHLSSEDLSSQDEHPTSTVYMQQPDLFPLVRKWLPPLRLERNFFTCYVTHITKSGVVYVQEESNILIVNEMCSEISSHITETSENCAQLKWHEGDICYAEFEAIRYYRAVIKSICREYGTCMIKYVDFGNKAMRRLEDLQVVTMFDDIPILAHRLFVPNLVPNSKTGQWSPIIWKEFTGRLLHEYCKCRVQDNVNTLNLKIVPCSIDPLRQPCEIFKWIHHEKLAIRTDLNAENDEILFVG